MKSRKFVYGLSCLLVKGEKMEEVVGEFGSNTVRLSSDFGASFLQIHMYMHMQCLNMHVFTFGDFIAFGLMSITSFPVI